MRQGSATRQATFPGVLGQDALKNFSLALPRSLRWGTSAIKLAEVDGFGVRRQDFGERVSKDSSEEGVRRPAGVNGA